MHNIFITEFLYLENIGIDTKIRALILSRDIKKYIILVKKMEAAQAATRQGANASKRNSSAHASATGILNMVFV